MRQFFRPAEGPHWLQSVLNSLREALSDIWPTPLRLKDYATADLPDATDWKQGLAYDSTLPAVKYSDGTNWQRLMIHNGGAALTRVDDTNVTVTLGGTPATALLQAVSLTLGWTGQLAVGRGGTGVAALSDITKADDTNVTVTLGGTPVGSVVQPVSFTLGWAGTLAVARGGTGGGAASGTLLDNITGFASTGIMARTGAGTYAFRTVTGTANEITATDGDGIAGNPTLSLPTSLTFTGKTITGGTYASVAGFTSSVDITVNGRAVGTGGQAASTVLGGTVSGTAAVSIGSSATAAGGAEAMGESAVAGSNGVAIGRTTNSGASGIAIGHSATASGLTGSIVLGRAATATASNQMVVGSETIPINNAFIGEGVTSTTPAANVGIQVTGGSGTNIVASNMLLAAGRSTGNAAPATIVFQTGTAGASGTTAQTLSTRATLSGTELNLGSGLGLQFNGTTVIDSDRLHRMRSYTVAGLPAAGTAGRRAYVTDANATTFASTVAGGGANVVPVFDNGTNWIIA